MSDDYSFLAAGLIGLAAVIASIGAEHNRRRDVMEQAQFVIENAAGSGRGADEGSVEPEK